MPTGDTRDRGPTQRDQDRASVLEEKGRLRTGDENNELQVLWLHRWIWTKIQEKFKRFQNDPEQCAEASL